MIAVLFYIKKIVFNIFISFFHRLCSVGVDALSSSVYDESASGRSGDRGSISDGIEESPDSTGRGAGESSERSDLLDGPQKTVAA